MSYKNIKEAKENKKKYSKTEKYKEYQRKYQNSEKFKKWRKKYWERYKESKMYEDSKLRQRIKYNKPRIVYTPEERIIRRNLRNREKCRKSRENVLITLGGKCIKCGFNDFRALQIDHIKNDGFKERRKKLSIFDFNKNVMESYLRNENRYQILCANCNWIKRWLLSQNNLDESPDLTFKIKVSKNDNA